MENDVDQPPSAPKSRAGRWLTTIGVGLPLLLWGIGQIWRDITWLTGLCFYIPSPLLWAWLVVVAGWLFSIRHRRACTAALLLSVAPACMVLLVENQWRRPEAQAVSAEGERPLRIVHWNVQRARRGWDRVIDRLLSMDADAYFLSEHTNDLSLERFEGYDTMHFLGMAVVVRGEINGRKTLRSEGPHFTFATEWISEHGPINVIMADVGAYLTIHREKELKVLNEQIRERRPDLVIGDLNAPRRSNQLSPPVDGYRHAYEAVGAGWSYTWPVPIPMYAIDQLLLGERIEPVEYELITSRRSDHRLQRFEFHLRDGAAASVASP